MKDDNNSRIVDGLREWIAAAAPGARLPSTRALVAQYRANELPYHLRFALQNGVTKDELTELVTHLAFYAGWPTANTAVGILRQTFAEPAK